MVLQHHDTNACGKFTLIAWRDGRARVWRAQCRSWHCPRCLPKRKRAIRALAMGGKPDTFLTLTCNPAETATPNDAARQLANAWKQLTRRIKRVYKLKRLPYLVVVESTKRGYPHLHVLLRVSWIEQRWLSQEWEALTGAKIVDIRRVSDRSKAAFYIAKYLGKDPHQFGKVKRYWHSRDWDQRPDHQAEREFWKGASFHRSSLSLEAYLIVMREAGWTADQGHDEFTLWRSPYQHDNPPLME